MLLRILRKTIEQVHAGDCRINSIPCLHIHPDWLAGDVPPSLQREREKMIIVFFFCSVAHHCVLAQEFLAAPDAITQESGM